MSPRTLLDSGGGGKEDVCFFFLIVRRKEVREKGRGGLRLRRKARTKREKTLPRGRGREVVPPESDQGCERPKQKREADLPLIPLLHCGKSRRLGPKEGKKKKKKGKQCTGLCRRFGSSRLRGRRKDRTSCF